MLENATGSSVSSRLRPAASTVLAALARPFVITSRLCLLATNPSQERALPREFPSERAVVKPRQLVFWDATGASIDAIVDSVESNAASAGTLLVVSWLGLDARSAPAARLDVSAVD